MHLQLSMSPSSASRYANHCHGNRNGSRPNEFPVNEESVQSIDEAALIEERRKRREAIKAKHRGQSTPLLMQALAHDNVSEPTAASQHVIVDQSCAPG